ncbi:hypothetical protein [Clostridium hydrogenum]|uniref:hypothetical protein n=1 Tax=Clostridium hydrogenum TaxID=2855764 RepID=UPI001F3E2A3E|nr:hypothetical protein [Clostridium hydrogenum]
MNVKLYLNGQLVGEGRIINLVEEQRMPSKLKFPGKVIIKMTTQLNSKIANSIIIDNDISYNIDLDDIFDYSIGSEISGDIYSKRKL